MSLANYIPAVKPKRTTAPMFEQEPVTIEQAKRQCRVGEQNTYDDGLFRDLIIGAREQLERDASIACYTGEYTIKKTYWTEFADGWFELNLRPITAITSIAYVATDGTSTTWDSANYSLDTYGVVPFVKLGHDLTWPSLRGDINGITVTCTAGYATVAAIPQRIKQAVLLHVHYHYLLSVGEKDEQMWQTYELLASDIARMHYS